MKINSFETNIAFLAALNPFTVYTVLFSFLILCGFGLPVPEDIILITGGYLAYEEVINVWAMIGIGLVGVIAGDSAIFLIGKKFGTRIISSKRVERLLSGGKLLKAQHYFDKYGNKIFFIARFLPGLRAPIYFTGGMVKSKFSVFFLFDFLAALISVPVWVYVAYYYGEYIHKVISIGKRVQFLILGAVVLIVVVKILLMLRNKKKVLLNEASQVNHLPEKLTKEKDTYVKEGTGCRELNP